MIGRFDTDWKSLISLPSQGKLLQMSRGVIYIASGSAYIRQAKTSAKSVKNHHPNLDITLFTDGNVNNSVFDSVKYINSDINEKGDSVLTAEHVVYDQNLYLDADTRVCGPIDGLFNILERNDIAAAYNEGRSWHQQSIYDNLDSDIPKTFPEYNSGVISYANTDQVLNLFNQWNKLYDEIGYERNQPAFRLALYESSINIGTLPPEYNFMTNNVGFISGDVKILHQGPSDEDLAEWEKVINSVSGKKVITWEKLPCRVIPDSYEGRRYKIKRLNPAKIKQIAIDAKEKHHMEGTLALINAAGSKIKRFVFGV